MDNDNIYRVNATLISNVFLENFLADANSDYIRVYLYIMWKNNQILNTNQIADELNLTINDVERAIKFWIKKEVIDESFLIQAKDKNEKVEKIDNDNVELNTKNDNNKILKLNNNVIKNQEEIDIALKDIVKFAENMLPAISSQQYELFSQLYTDFNMSIEVIQYLIEYCVEQKKITSSYMKKIAISWYEQGIDSEESARNFVEQYNQNKKLLVSKAKIKNKKIEKSNNNEKIDYDKEFLKRLN